jgi:DNA polymerase-3 subunit delta'
MLFSEVIGQEQIKLKLISSVKSERIAHTQLFYGPDGSGTLPLAIAYAQYIACAGEKDSDSCGKCPSCIKFARLAHPDLHFAFPVNTTKKIVKDPVSDDFITEWREFVLNEPYFSSGSWYDYIGIENKQGIISKRDGDSIIRKLNLKSFESDYKFMIIWLPEKMHTSTANMLLKLLEEPPEKTLFLLISEEPGQILPTILSRTQQVKLSHISEEALKASLRSRFTLSETEIDNITRLAGGSYLGAMNAIKTSEENEMNLKQFIAIMRLSWTRNFHEINDWVETMSGLGREKLKSFFDYALRLVRENFISNIDEPGLVYMTSEESKFAINFHKFINGENVIPIYEEMNKAAADIERNGYAKVVLFDFALRLTKLIRS